jgi:hypothetical protein
MFNETSLSSVLRVGVKKLGYKDKVRLPIYLDDLISSA